MKSHICGVQGECNDYCGGGQMANLRKQLAAESATVAALKDAAANSEAACIAAEKTVAELREKIKALEAGE